MIKNVSVVLLHICLSVRKTTSYSFIGGKKILVHPPPVTRQDKGN